MKYLLILLITFNAHARLKVDIINSYGQPMFQEFDTQVETDKYILKHVEKNQWGLSEYTKTDCGNSFKTRSNITTGNDEYLCPVDFSVSISDITVEYDAKKAKKDTDDLSLTAIRLKLTDGSAKLEDIIEYIKIKEGI